MAVIRKKWQYGFKPAKEVPVCHTAPLQALLTADYNVDDIYHHSNAIASIYSADMNAVHCQVAANPQTKPTHSRYKSACRLL